MLKVVGLDRLPATFVDPRRGHKWGSDPIVVGLVVASVGIEAGDWAAVPWCGDRRAVGAETRPHGMAARRRDGVAER